MRRRHTGQLHGSCLFARCTRPHAITHSAQNRWLHLRRTIGTVSKQIGQKSQFKAESDDGRNGSRSSSSSLLSLFCETMPQHRRIICNNIRERIGSNLPYPRTILREFILYKLRKRVCVCDLLHLVTDQLNMYDVICVSTSRVQLNKRNGQFFYIP